MVQGKGAERGIARALERIDNWEENGLPQVEAVIVGRGGGSLEDLWNFNEEVVARAIAACRVPVVSAVGHEIDFTIADFVADLRAPTPSAAAELVVPDQGELKARISTLGARLERRVEDGIQRRQEAMRYLAKTAISLSAETVLREPITRLDEADEGLERATQQALDERQRKIDELAARWKANRPSAVMARQNDRLKDFKVRSLNALEAQMQRKEAKVERYRDLIKALGPESAFERGFSITMDEEGKVLKDATAVKKGMRLETVMKGGKVASVVE